MNLNKDLIKNKQRILISGNKGVKEIFSITKTVLKHVGKPVDFIDLTEASHQISDAPVAILVGGDEIENGKAVFHKLDIHVLLIHQITDKTPEGYGSFDAYVDQYEQLADSLPKSGSLIYNGSDDVALLLGKKDREDVRNIEYSSLKQGDVENEDPDFLAQAAAAKILLNRIGVSDQQFFAGLKTL